MKKALRILLAVILVLSLCPLAIAEEEINIHIMHWAGLPFEENLFQQWARSYEEAHPNVKIEVESVADGYSERLTTLFSAGDAPDIFYLAFSDAAAMIEQGMLEPLDDYITGDNPMDLSDLVSDNLILKYKDHTYGWTNGGAPYMLFYNKAMFDEAGLAYPTAEWTYDDLAENAKKLNVTDDAGNTTVYGFQCDEYPRLWLSIFWSNGGQLFDDEITPTQVMFDSEAGVIATCYMSDLVQTYGAAPTPGNTGALSYREAFMNRKVAMVADGAWQGSQYRSALGDDMGVIMLPTADDGSRLCWSSACFWPIASTSEHKDVAWDIMKTWFCGYEGLLQFCDYGGDNAVTMPIFKSMLTDERYHPSEYVTLCADAVPYCRVDPLFEGAGTWEWNILGAAIEEAMLMGTDPAEVLANAKALTESEVLVKFQ